MAADWKKAPEGYEGDVSGVPVRGRAAGVGGVMGWLLSRSGAVRRWWLIGYWGLIFFLTHWPNVDDFPGARWLPVDSDLVVHFCMYAGWAASWWWVLAGRGMTLRGRVVGCVLAGGAAYGAFDELSQAMVGRDPALSDFMMDMGGIATALLLLGWWSACKGRGGK